ncbi:Ff.00g044050.m01.CDS01 [Fusarium sp. VM40]|nr:Ff.00g044050.m01.CDS01 [Fusarium sp. VM40]
MDALRAGFENRASSRLRMPTPANVFSRGRRKRPVISAPMGPIKNSRGPDLTRSETFIIVPTIKDCVSDESLSDKENNEAKKTTRRISASFSTHGSLASPPTVAKSSIIATTSYQSLTKAAPIKSLPTTSSFQSVSDASVAKSYSYGVYPSLESIIQDENVPPPDHKESAPQVSASEPMSKSRLPKSRTLSVLSDIKTSISRSSLNAKQSTSRTLADPSRKISGSSTSSLFASSTSRLRLPRASLTSIPRSSSSSTTATEVQPDPNQITTSQPSAYWSGRFVSLHDRFLSEEFSNEKTVTSGSSFGNSFEPHAMTTDRVAVNSRPTHLSHSTTTSALTSLTITKPRSSPSTKDARCKRIFEHLEGLCATSEARRSLFAWQQTYARRMGKPQLLPQGGRMENNSLMGKIFGAGPRTGGRRSLPVMGESSAVPTAKKTKPRLAIGGHGKRLSTN